MNEARQLNGTRTTRFGYISSASLRQARARPRTRTRRGDDDGCTMPLVSSLPPSSGPADELIRSRVGRSNHMSKMSTACKLSQQLLPTGLRTSVSLCRAKRASSARDVGGETVSSSVVWSRSKNLSRMHAYTCMRWQCCRLI